MCRTRFTTRSPRGSPRAKKLKVGAGLDAGVEQGPLIEPAAVDKVERHVEDARAKGAKVPAGGRRHALGGQFYEPTVLSGGTADMVISHEETFGPAAPLWFADEAEVIRHVNKTEYGLASYFFARDVGRVFSGWPRRSRPASSAERGHLRPRWRRSAV